VTAPLIEQRTAPIVAEQVRRWFMSGDERIVPVDGVDLCIEAGELVVLTGPSGSGKTTLLQMLAGFQRPDEGAVRWHDTDGHTPAWDVVAVVPQTLGLLAELTAAENVALPLLARGVPPEQAQAEVDVALAALRVDHLAHRLVGEASLGQQQRVAVARAVVGSSAVIVADEPTSHQDAEHADVVLAALRDAARRGAACVLAGHDPRLAAVADRVLHLEQGRLAT
jgi:ABC-type lipoprotein export system ATPase subunit